LDKKSGFHGEGRRIGNCREEVCMEKGEGWISRVGCMEKGEGRRIGNCSGVHGKGRRLDK